ncbi:MAG: hypothetical protein U0M73_04015 [Christensenellales bacterium]
MEQYNEISMDGFKVVSSDFFCTVSRVSAPTITVWDGSIGFSKQDLLLLNSCENVLMQINAENKKILVVPTSSKDKDAIKWVKKTNPLEAKKFSCPKLTDNLYDAWNWDKDYIYRATGRLVTVQNKVMLYFDFSEPEKWKKPEAKDAK